MLQAVCLPRLLWAHGQYQGTLAHAPSLQTLSKMLADGQLLNSPVGLNFEFVIAAYKPQDKGTELQRHVQGETNVRCTEPTLDEKVRCKGGCKRGTN